MRRLRQLWNKQRYLTDDEMESCKDTKDQYFLEDGSISRQINLKTNKQ